MMSQEDKWGGPVRRPYFAAEDTLDRDVALNFPPKVYTRAICQSARKLFSAVFFFWLSLRGRPLSHKS
jgi:hypothetical protein